MVIRLFIAFFALFSFVGNSGVSVAQVNPEIIVKVDPQQGTIADEFVLSVVLQNVDSSEAPRLESSKDFEVQPIGPQSQVTIVNGVVSRRVVWRFRLRPTHEGTLQPPQVTVDIGGDLQVREPRAVIVTKSAAAIPPQAQLDGVELVQRVDRSPVYLGQQLIASLDLAFSTRIVDPQFPDLSYDGFLTKIVADNERSSRVRGGEQFEVVRFRRALYPLRSGKIILQPRTMKMKVPDRSQRSSPFGGQDPFDLDIFQGMFGGHFGRLRDVTISSNASEVEVRELPPLPANFPLWGATLPVVGETVLELSFDEKPIAIGGTRTLQLKISSTGNLNALKALPAISSEGLRVYEEPSESKEFLSGGNLLTEKVFKASLVPSQAGAVSLPPFELGVFDTIEERFRVLRTRPLQFEVVGDARQIKSPPATVVAEATPTPLAEQEESSFARFASEITVGLALLIVCFVALTIFFGWWIWRVIDSGRPMRRTITRLQNAPDIPSLRAAITDFVRESYGDRTGVSDLATLLRTKGVDREHEFMITTFLDALDEASFSAHSEKAGEGLERLRFKAIELVKIL